MLNSIEKLSTENANELNNLEIKNLCHFFEILIQINTRVKQISFPKELIVNEKNEYVNKNIRNTNSTN